MIAFPAGAKVWRAGGATGMRSGMNGLALKVREGLGRDPRAGGIFGLRGRRGDLVEPLWHDGAGMSLPAKRLEAGGFIRPVSPTGAALAISAIFWTASTGATQAGRRGPPRRGERGCGPAFVGLC